MQPNLKTRAAWLRGVAARLNRPDLVPILQGYAEAMERKAADAEVRRDQAAGRWA